MIPFHLFSYEHQFHEYDINEAKMEELTNHYLYLLKRLRECVEQGILNVYVKNAIVAMTKKVMNHLTEKHEKVKKKLGDVMGGKILNYEAKDILNRGIERGIEQGIEQGETQKLVTQIKKKVEKGQSAEQIAEALEESVQTIEKMIKEYL